MHQTKKGINDREFQMEPPQPSTPQKKRKSIKKDSQQIKNQIKKWHITGPLFLSHNLSGNMKRKKAIAQPATVLLALHTCFSGSPRLAFTPASIMPKSIGLC